MDTLPRFEEAVIPVEKFTQYILTCDQNKAIAFERALGFTVENTIVLIQRIRKGLSIFPANAKPDLGYGQRYEVIMFIEGLNGKTAKVLTAWIDDKTSGEMRLVTAHIDD